MAPRLARSTVATTRPSTSREKTWQLLHTLPTAPSKPSNTKAAPAGSSVCNGTPSACPTTRLRRDCSANLLPQPRGPATPAIWSGTKPRVLLHVLPELQLRSSTHFGGFMISLAGKAAIITGGSRGIGAAAVKMFAEAGADVVFTYNKAKDAAK